MRTLLQSSTKSIATTIPIAPKLAEIAAYGKALRITQIMALNGEQIDEKKKDLLLTFGDEECVNDLIKQLVVVKSNMAKVKAVTSDAQIVERIQVMQDEISIKKKNHGQQASIIYNRLYPLRWLMQYNECHRTGKITFSRRSVAEVNKRIDVLVKERSEAVRSNRGAIGKEIEILQWSLGNGNIEMP